MAYLSRRCLGLVVSVSAGIGMAFPLCLTIERYNTTVSIGRRHLESAWRFFKRGNKGESQPVALGIVGAHSLSGSRYHRARSALPAPGGGHGRDREDRLRLSLHRGAGLLRRR